MSGWLGQHRDALASASQRFGRAPLASAFTVLVIAIALTLPAALALLVANVRGASGDFEEAVDVTVYFHRGTPLEKVRALAEEAQARPGIASVRVISADEALEGFRKEGGFREALGALTDNPLPHTLELRPAADARDPTRMEALREYLSAWPDAELVQLDSDWVRRLNAMLDLLRRIVIGTAVLLGTGVVAVIGNTVRLEIQNHRTEIEITKLVGGSNAFVRRPFLYAGILYGLFGAVLASLAVLAGCRLLAGPVAVLAQSYGSDFRIAAPTWGQTGLLLALGGGLGLVGAFLSASRQLSRIEARG